MRHGVVPMTHGLFGSVCIFFPCFSLIPPSRRQMQATLRKVSSSVEIDFGMEAAKLLSIRDEDPRLADAIAANLAEDPALANAAKADLSGTSCQRDMVRPGRSVGFELGLEIEFFANGQAGSKNVHVSLAVADTGAKRKHLMHCRPDDGCVSRRTRSTIERFSFHALRRTRDVICFKCNLRLRARPSSLSMYTVCRTTACR